MPTSNPSYDVFLKADVVDSFIIKRRIRVILAEARTTNMILGAECRVVPLPTTKAARVVLFERGAGPANVARARWGIGGGHNNTAAAEEEERRRRL